MRKFTLFFLIVMMVLTCNMAFGGGKTVLLSPGDKFPNLIFSDELGKKDKEYLGIKTPFFSFTKKENILLEEIQGELLFIEFFNKYCTSCQLQAPVNNKVYDAVISDNNLKDRVKFIGIGAGNSKREVDSFRNEKKIRFPLLSDQDFNCYEDIGDPGGTPYMLLVKKTDSGFTVYSSHMGLNKDNEFFVKEIRDALKTDIKTLTHKKKEVDFKISQRKLELDISEEEIIQNVELSINRVLKNEPPADKTVTKKMSAYEGLYMTKVSSGFKEDILYSKVLSRKPVCDVCHGIHFIVTFDAVGTIRDVHAIHLTKYGNVVWNEEDLKTINLRLVGMKIDGKIQFNSEVDAVSTATMTSSLMYNSIKRLKPVIDRLRKESN